MCLVISGVGGHKPNGAPTKGFKVAKAPRTMSGGMQPPYAVPHVASAWPSLVFRAAIQSQRLNGVAARAALEGFRGLGFRVLDVGVGVPFRV